MDELKFRSSKEILDKGIDGESGFQTTLNDLLSLPGITIQFDDTMRKLCDDIENLNNEELFSKVSEITKIYNYPFDLRSYWLIDIIAGFLINGKRKGLSNENLWATLGWFMFIFNGFRENKWTHESLMQHIQCISVASAQEVKIRDKHKSSEDQPTSIITAVQVKASVQTIPLKTKQKKGSKKLSSVSSADTLTQSLKGTRKLRQTIKMFTPKPEVNYTLEDLLIIVNIFYDLFAMAFQFKLLQWSLLDLDQVITLELPYPINIPRDMKAPSSPVLPEPSKSEFTEELSIKGKDKASKKKKKGKSEDDKTKEQESQSREGKSKLKDKKSKKSKKSSEVDKMKNQQEFQQAEDTKEETEENWEVDDNIYILPLQDADEIGKEFFLELFPEIQEKSVGKKIKSPKKKGRKK